MKVMGVPWAASFTGVFTDPSLPTWIPRFFHLCWEVLLDFFKSYLSPTIFTMCISKHAALKLYPGLWAAEMMLWLLWLQSPHRANASIVSEQGMWANVPLLGSFEHSFTAGEKSPSNAAPPSWLQAPVHPSNLCLPDRSLTQSHLCAIFFFSFQSQPHAEKFLLTYILLICSDSSIPCWYLGRLPQFLEGKQTPSTWA